MQNERITLLIGGNGRMARMLMRCAEGTGETLRTLDQPLLPDRIRTACQDVSLALFCVPALVLDSVLAAVCPNLPKDCVISDITSVKEMPVSRMESVWEGSVVGTHPLFGPNPDFNGPLPVAVTPGKKTTAKALALVEDFYARLGFQTFCCSVEVHDKAMADIQNLNFITTLAYFALLAGREDLYPFLTPSFRRRMQAAKKMLTEDAAMFSGLFEANPYSHASVRRFRHYLNLAASGDIELLCRKAATWWDEEKKKS